MPFMKHCPSSFSVLRRSTMLPCKSFSIKNSEGGAFEAQSQCFFLAGRFWGGKKRWVQKLHCVPAWKTKPYFWISGQLTKKTGKGLMASLLLEWPGDIASCRSFLWTIPSLLYVAQSKSIFSSNWEMSETPECFGCNHGSEKKAHPWGALRTQTGSTSASSWQEPLPSQKAQRRLQRWQLTSQKKHIGAMLALYQQQRPACVPSAQHPFSSHSSIQHSPVASLVRMPRPWDMIPASSLLQVTSFPPLKFPATRILEPFQACSHKLFPFLGTSALGTHCFRNSLGTPWR